VPFGIAQVGRSFRNEIITGNFIFRDREFEQMEMEFFVKPGTEDNWHDHWRDERLDWWKRTFAIREEHIRIKVIRREGTTVLGPDPDDVEQEKPPHYSKGNYDIEYKFPMGWSEIEGIASRTDYDLGAHQKLSGKTLEYFDDETKEKYIPYVVEPAMGVERSVLVALFESYHEEQVREEKRVVLKLPKALAPIKVAVLPLARNRPEIVSLAEEIAATLRPHMLTVYDDTASIGRLYRRQDEVGTLWCVTVDHQSAIPSDEKYDGKVTVRDRDTMEQIRVPVDQVKDLLVRKLSTA
jgi:glycyl-tRNA synthetase